MKKIKVHVVGDGVFGTFLRGELKPHVTFDSANPELVFMAVPYSAYEAVAKKYKGRHLVNICSIQSLSSLACHKYTKEFTSIHPMYGPRSPKEGRTAVVTYGDTEKAGLVVGLFCQMGVEVHGKWMIKVGNTYACSAGAYISPEEHDRIMARTHLPVVMFGEMAREMVDRVKNVPDWMLPTSFKKLKALVDQMRDMPKGTLDSIKANPYW